MKPGWRMFGDEVAHDHPDTTTLTIGCAGCIHRANVGNTPALAEQIIGFIGARQ